MKPLEFVYSILIIYINLVYRGLPKVPMRKYASTNTMWVINETHADYLLAHVRGSRELHFSCSLDSTARAAVSRQGPGSGIHPYMVMA